MYKIIRKRVVLDKNYVEGTENNNQEDVVPFCLWGIL